MFSFISYKTGSARFSFELLEGVELTNPKFIGVRTGVACPTEDSGKTNTREFCLFPI